MPKYLDLEAHTGIDIATILGWAKRPLENGGQHQDETQQAQDVEKTTEGGCNYVDGDTRKF